MKKLIIFSISILFIFSISCSDKSNPVKTEQSGKILLKIDRENAPQNVTLVRATLSRSGYSNITATLNILSDSTADLTLDEIPAGTWHLKIEAMNSSLVVLYMGETSVNILPNMITQVSLVLQPVGQGTGSIQIFVTWGTQQTNLNWVDFTNNPVISGGNQSFDFYGVAQPKVIFDEGKYKMWYYGDGGNGRTVVLYAESLNGITWTKHPFPVLTTGAPGDWDSWSVQPGYVIKENNTYRMYYSGFADQNSAWHIGLATSVDGINWVKKPEPVFYALGGWEFQLNSYFVIKKDNKYYLYYIGRNGLTYNIGLAISTDGLNFTRHSNNPILTATQSWEQNGVLSPSVYFENGTYKMVYQDGRGNGFGYAYSSDGIFWTKDNNNPFFRRQNTSNLWGNANISYPLYIKVNNEERIYYAGYSSSSTKYKIGFMRKNN
jgi:predicted GH43/DUF377 family glycosyl hydrolase